MQTVLARVFSNACLTWGENYLQVKDSAGRIGSVAFSRNPSVEERLVKRYFKDLINGTQYQREGEKEVWHKVSVPDQLANYMTREGNSEPLMLLHRIVLPKTGPVLLSERESRMLSPILSNGVEIATRSGAFDMHYTHIILDAVVVNERIGVVLCDEHEWSDGRGGSGCSGTGMTSILRAVIKGAIYSRRANYRHSSDPEKDREYEYMGTKIHSAHAEKDGKTVTVWVTTDRGHFELEKVRTRKVPSR